MVTAWPATRSAIHIHRAVKQRTENQTTSQQALHQALTADDGHLQRRLLRLRDDAGLPSAVSAVRVFDVLAWMSGRPGRPQLPGTVPATNADT
jgi:hypothetical protein